MVTVAVVPTIATLTDNALVAVVDIPFTRATTVPSIVICSLLPLPKFVTVNTSELISCPLSTVLILLPLNSATADPPSVKVGVAPVAVNVGASFTAITTTEILAAALVLLPPSPSLTVTLIVRVVVVGSVILVLI